MDLTGVTLCLCKPSGLKRLAIFVKYNFFIYRRRHGIFPKAYNNLFMLLVVTKR